MTSTSWRSGGQGPVAGGGALLLGVIALPILVAAAARSSSARGYVIAAIAVGVYGLVVVFLARCAHSDVHVEGADLVVRNPCSTISLPVSAVVRAEMRGAGPYHGIAFLIL